MAKRDYEAIRFLAIDPGLSGTGLARFTHGRLEQVYAVNHTVGDWTERLFEYTKSVFKVAEKYRVGACIIEYPSLFQTSGGMTVARSGNLLKLTMLCGALFSVLELYNPELLPVNTWKGNLKKDVVRRRIKRLIPTPGDFTLNSHTWDAVGMGMHVLGKF